MILRCIILVILVLSYREIKEINMNVAGIKENVQHVKKYFYDFYGQWEQQPPSNFAKLYKNSPRRQVPVRAYEI